MDTDHMVVVIMVVNTAGDGVTVRNDNGQGGG